MGLYHTKKLLHSKGNRQQNEKKKKERERESMNRHFSIGICCMAQETQTGDLCQPRGVGWGGRWEGVSKRRGYMYTYG